MLFTSRQIRLVFPRNLMIRLDFTTICAGDLHILLPRIALLSPATYLSQVNMFGYPSQARSIDIVSSANHIETSEAYCIALFAIYPRLISLATILIRTLVSKPATVTWSVGTVPETEVLIHKQISWQRPQAAMAGILTVPRIRATYDRFWAHVFMELIPQPLLQAQESFHHDVLVG
jgi:hypothetical protein